MANTVTTSTIFEVNQAGSDTACSGGFDPANTHMDATLSATSATGSSPVVSSSNYNFVAGDVGFWIFIKSGTNWTPGWYQIASVASNQATLTASIGSAYLYDSNTANCSGLTTAAGCATTASPTAGTWTMDYSFMKAGSARFSYTDLAIDSVTNTKLTSAAHPFGVNCVGNVIQVTAGTGFTLGFSNVLSVSGTTATMTVSAGTTSSTSGTGCMGGALATIGMACGAIPTSSSQNTVYVNYSSGTAYSTTSTSSNVSGGKAVIPGGGSLNGPTFALIGYSTSRWVWNQDSNRPQIAAGINSAVIVAASSNNLYATIRNLSLTNASSFTSTTGFSIGAGSLIGGLVTDCKVDSFATSFDGGASSVFFKCEASNYSSYGFHMLSSGDAVTCMFCSAHGGGSGSFGFYQIQNVLFCLAYSSGGASASYGIYQNSGQPGIIAFNTIYSITGANSAGIFISNNCNLVTNNVVTNCGKYGYTFNQNTIIPFVDNNADYNNATSAYNGGVVGATIFNKVALSSSPFVNAAGANFAILMGNACRAAGYPTSIPPGTTAIYNDLGAAQAADTGSGTVVTFRKKVR